MEYQGNANQLIFDSNPSVQIIPKEWSRFYSLLSPPGFSSHGTLFLHRMKKPDGEVRLVVVDILTWGFGDNTTNATFYWVFQPGAFFQSPAETSPHAQSIGDEFSTSEKIFAGTVDPSDPTHFSFRTLQDNKEKIYDGWLQNDERVIIGQRK